MATALLSTQPLVAASDEAKLAATCAAHDLANWDFERETRDPADVSEAWKKQAEGYRRLAIARGMSEAEADRLIAASRPKLTVQIKAWLYSTDPALESAQEKLMKHCARLMKRAPEMAPYR
ncbi:MAG: hypothetical protein ACRBCL_09095 [Maritimibacter sp.]